MSRHRYISREFWDDLLIRDPALAIVEGARAEQDHASDPAVMGLAWGTVARAHFELGRLPEARAAARAAIDTLDGDLVPDVLVAVAMMSAVVLAESGDVNEGLDLLAPLAARVGPPHSGRIEIQRAYLLSQAGRLNASLLAFESADRNFACAGEPTDRFRLLTNRGLVLLQQGRLDAADADFAAAEALAVAEGLVGYEALSLANRAVLAGRARRLPESVELFRRAADRFRAVGNPARMVIGMEIDRAEVMLHSGLVLDAVAAAQRACDLAKPTGNRIQLGDAQMLLARAELGAGDHRGAIASADAAESTFDEAGRHEMCWHARSIAAIAALQRARSPGEAAAKIVDASGLADELRDHGWHRQADNVLVEQVRVANRHGLLDRVVGALDVLRTGAGAAQRDIGLVGWYAEALTRRRDRDLLGALAACRAGFAPLDDIIAEAETLEQRSAVMRLGSDLGHVAIACAVELDDPELVWDVAEGTRARALHDELVRPTRHRALDDVGAHALRAELVARLGDRTLVEWVVANGRVLAVVVHAGRFRLVDVGDVAAVVRQRDRVLMWLDTAATEPDVSSTRAAAACRSLDDVLLAPLELPPTGGVVIVPDDLMHGIPWAAMTGLLDRPHVVSPSAQLWLSGDHNLEAAPGSVGYLVGPDVAGADDERDAIERCYRGAVIAEGPAATASAISTMLATREVVHVAAHGRFRSDRPLLSTMHLSGGHATLDETVPERVASRIVVLSSCEAGAQGISDGSEVLGFGAVLLARGAASVVAPLTLVRDLQCGAYAAEVHIELASGAPVAEAVGRVRRRWLDDGALERWAVASSFTCFGSGSTSIGGPARYGRSGD